MSGLPQGSLLGRVLFSSYIKSLRKYNFTAYKSSIFCKGTEIFLQNVDCPEQGHYSSSGFELVPRVKW